MDRLESFRALFPIVGERSYLYNGALAPAATPVRAALTEWCERWAHDPIACYDGADEECAVLRAAFAGLIGAEAGEIGLTDNTSRASNLIVSLLAGRAGSNVVIDDTTYPSSAYPWMTMTTHEIRRVESSRAADPLDAIASAVDAETVAVSVTHVAPETGFRHDLRPLADVAHAHDAVLIVDAAQSTGVLPVDVRRDGVDALVTTAMKWMLGLPGVGLAYVARELLADAPVQQVGYVGIDLEMSESWPMTTLPPIVPDGRKLELGLPALHAMRACAVGIGLLQEAGIDRVEQRVEALVTRLIDGLTDAGATVRTPADPARRAGVVAIADDDAVGLGAAARDAGVDIGAYPWGVARIDPHAFNSEADVDAFVQVVRARSGRA